MEHGNGGVLEKSANGDGESFLHGGNEENKEGIGKEGGKMMYSKII